MANEPMIKGWCLAAALAFQFTTSLADGQSAARHPGALMDRQQETALALSACPTSIAGRAAVYVLEASGYVKVRQSQNGFTAIVQHSVPAAQEPQCMDSEGTRTVLPRYLKVAEMRAQGKTAGEIKQFVTDAFAKGLFKAPRRVGIDYMLSTENMVPDDDGVIAHFPPHVMFYAPFLTNTEVGSEGQASGAPVFVAAQGTPYALIIVPLLKEAQGQHHH